MRAKLLRRVRQSARFPLVVTLLFSAACSSAPDSPVDEGQKIVQAALKVLASDGKGVCVDGRTTGRPLAIYAAMRAAPSPSRRPLAWHVPGQLRPLGTLSNMQLYRDSLGSESAHLQDPQQAEAALPVVDQRRLDDAATKLALSNAAPGIAISPRWATGVKARWWPMNRLSRSCLPTYRLSNPVWSGSIGYVTVMTEHWGTTYAFERNQAGWEPVGQWTNWLY